MKKRHRGKEKEKNYAVFRTGEPFFFTLDKKEYVDILKNKRINFEMALIEVENEANIDFDKELYQNFINQENFPEGIILLVLRNEPISGFDTEVYGVTISTELYNSAAKQNFHKYFQKYFHKYFKKYFDPNTFDPNTFEHKWKASIALAKKICKIDEYPVFFSYCLIHELGHAYEILSNPQDFIRSLIAQDFYNYIYNKFKEKDSSLKPIYKLPHEKRCDQFGLYFIKNNCLKDKFKEEIEKKIEKNEVTNSKRFLSVLEDLTSSNDLSGLWEEMKRCLEIYKNEIEKLWEENINRGINNKISYYTENFNGFVDFWK